MATARSWQSRGGRRTSTHVSLMIVGPWWVCPTLIRRRRVRRLRRRLSLLRSSCSIASLLNRCPLSIHLKLQRSRVVKHNEQFRVSRTGWRWYKCHAPVLSANVTVISMDQFRTLMSQCAVLPGVVSLCASVFTRSKLSKFLGYLSGLPNKLCK